MKLPSLDTSLSSDHVHFLEIFKKSCAQSILRMLQTSQSGHPGGSLSSLDILAVLYAFRLNQTHENFVVSNGHISPGVYSVLAELGTIDKEEICSTFRQLHSIYEGHVTRHVSGIPYGTGPLGIGVSVACGMALSQKRKNEKGMTFALMGDGEAQEGQVHEVALMAAKEKLHNFCVFVDYNAVQLTASLEETMPINIAGIFDAHGWNVMEIDGHDPKSIWEAVQSAEASDEKPTLVIANTIMGKYVPGMEEEGMAYKSTWHGKAPKPEEIETMLVALELSFKEEQVLKDFRSQNPYKPAASLFEKPLSHNKNIKAGQPIVYDAKTLTDCRSAYGKALLDLAKHNKSVFAMTADLGGSVMTKFVEEELPEQFAEVGICEQNMVSMAGGMSLTGFVPFVSTFGAFMSSRAKDQARVNDINQTNVKMVATHSGLSVGEDGPTHQAIDDMGSFVGMFHTHVIEPADPNHCDRIIRYIATRNGNFYVRMGRHKIPTLTKEDGSLLFGADYVYEYGKTETLRTGKDVTIVTTGATTIEALKAVEASGVSADIIIASSIKQFDQNLIDSLKKTKKVITVEDHNYKSGLGAAVALLAAENSICLEVFKPLAVNEYQLSGTALELYGNVGIDAAGIAKILNNIKR